MVKVELPAFDTLRYLAEHDPERLEHLRQALTELLISRSPEESRQRLRGLQFQSECAHHPRTQPGRRLHRRVFDDARHAGYAAASALRGAGLPGRYSNVSASNYISRTLQRAAGKPLKSFELPDLIGRLLVRMGLLQARYHSGTISASSRRQLQPIFRHFLYLSGTANKGADYTRQRTKLPFAQNLPGTLIVSTNPASTGFRISIASPTPNDSPAHRSTVYT